VLRASRVFPGTNRRYWVYLPAQYTASEPASLMVFQDGHAYVDREGDMRVPVVFDNLIHQGEMPVTVVSLSTPASLRQSYLQSWDGIQSPRTGIWNTTHSVMPMRRFC
jgi:hypothetical protein